MVERCPEREVAGYHRQCKFVAGHTDLHRFADGHYDVVWSTGEEGKIVPTGKTLSSYVTPFDRFLFDLLEKTRTKIQEEDEEERRQKAQRYTPPPAPGFWRRVADAVVRRG